LKVARGALGLSQTEAASGSSVPVGTLRKYEQGPSLPGAEAIAGFIRLGINSNWLLTGEGPMLLADLNPAGNLEPERLRLSIETVEEGLRQTKRTMEPAKRAELVLAVYDLYADGVGAQARERILRLVKSAA